MARTLLIACGALAREIKASIDVSGLQGFELICLPADLHNRPELIAPAVREKIHDARGHYARIAVVYGECGTGGELDRVLEEEDVERIAGPHCYSFFAGHEEFTALAEQDPGTFYLTDYMVRQFDSIVWKGLGLDQHFELRDMYFGNYNRVVYLAQTRDASLEERAQDAAKRLGLELTIQHTGLGLLPEFVERQLPQSDTRTPAADAKETTPHATENHRILAGHPSPGLDQTRPENRPSPTLRAFREGRRHGRDARKAHRNRRLSG